MTAPDPAPSVEDVIAEAVESVIDVFDTVMNVHHEAQGIAAAVVAAIRGVTVEQKAELIGGFVAVKMAGGAAVIAVGPWRAEP